MALTRAIALKDASASALSSGANGTIYDLSSIIYNGAKLYAGVHLVMACSTAAGPDSFVAYIQSASSSGANFGTLATTEFIFSAMTSRGGQWATSTPGGNGPGATIGSTDRKFWRARWTLSTGSQAPSIKFIEWVSIR